MGKKKKPDPRQIPLESGKFLVLDSWPYGPGNFRGEHWQLRTEQLDFLRYLDEYESSFINSTIAHLLGKEQQDGQANSK